MITRFNHIAQNYSVPMLWELGTLPLNAAGMYLQRSQFGKAQRESFGKHNRQYLLYYLPPESIERKTTWIVFYHGGGWHFGQPGMLPRLADFFLQLGYPIVMPAYRLSPRYQFGHMREDLNLALLKTFDIMQDVAGRRENMILAGASAGANLAAHLMYNTDVHRDLGVDSDLFKGFLSCAGPLDLRHLPDTFPLRAFTGGKHLSPAFDAANPINLIADDRQLPPALFIHGTADRIVPYPSGKSFFELYKQRAEANLITLPNKWHLDSVRWTHDDLQTGEEIRAWLGEVEI
ncbi:MAG: alpha/beta hydrolase [Saprospiraceae bacterium]|nr:alpha/beta hydrolase [Saprospiraceae bacterium]